MRELREMLNPQSVALIGASDKENSVGKAALGNLLRSASRPVYAVNPNRRSALDVPCFPSIRDVPSPVDLAVIATPADTVPSVVGECGEAGVAGAIILSAGFARSDPKGRMLEQEITDARRKHGMRIIGPSCLGVVLPHIGLNATFLAIDSRPGNIALISRVLGDAILDWGGTMGIGFSMFVSLGRMIDVGYGDIIDFLSNDYDTRSIMIYMEDVGDARRFISAARGFALNKPIVVFKPGRSEIGARVNVARAGRTISDDRVYDAVFKRVGAVRVEEMSFLFRMAELLDSRNLPRGPRLAIITNAGDVGMMAADTLTGSGGELAILSGDTAETPDLLLPERWSADDPIDLAGDRDVRRYVGTIKASLRDDGVDGVLVAYTPRSADAAQELAGAVAEISRRAAKPIIVAWIGGEIAADGRRTLLQNNVPVYATPDEAVKTYLYMYSYRRNLELLYETPAEVAQTGSPLKNYLKTAIRKAAKERRMFLGAEHSLDLLRNYGIRPVRTEVVANLDEVRKTIQEVGLPLWLTVHRPREAAEDEVMLLGTQEDTDRTCSRIRRQFTGGGLCSRHGVEIVLHKAAEPDSFALRLRSERDPEFRTVLFLCAGSSGPHGAGIGLPPLNQILARRLIESAGVYPLFRNAPEGQQALVKLEEVLLGFSDMVVDFPEIESAELVLWVWRTQVLAGDVRIVPSRDFEGSSAYSHLVITPYPSRYVTTWTLPDGTAVTLRPIRPEDEPMSRKMLASLSGETLRVRYFGVREITRDLLIRSCNIDYDREIAIIAEIREEGERRMIGGSRLITEPDSGRGQFAILVHDDYQRMGLGAKLMDILIGIAGEKQLDEIHGLVLRENTKMLTLCRKLGFRVKSEPDGVSRVSLTLKT